jgi:hypothetical protein
VKETIMKTHDIHRYRMLVRVREFGVAHRDLFPAGGPAGQLLAAFSKAVDQLSTYITEQDAGRGASREGAMSKAGARDALNGALDAIARTARALDTPGLGGKFRLPSVRNDHELATAARRFQEGAAALKAQFVSHGLPKSFLTDLQAALDAFERATQDRLAAIETSAAAAAGIGTAMDLALAALTRLDAIVANTLRGEPTMLAAWTTARRVARVRGRAGREEAPVAASSAGSPADVTQAGAVTPVPASSKMPETGEAA